MRATLVTHDSVFTRYLAARLSDAGALDRLIVERRAAPPRFYWRKLKRVGVPTALFQFWLTRDIRRAGAGGLGGEVAETQAKWGAEI